MYKFIDLFCGIGGFRKALESKNLECVFSSDIDKDVQETYKRNFGDKPCGDITEIPENKIPKHDILCAGFPCQSFSISGKRLGIEDNNGKLFYAIIRIAQYYKPYILLLENVKNILNINNGSVIKTIDQKLSEIGYKVYRHVLNASLFGVPQPRERVYFVCLRKDSSSEYNLKYIKPKESYKTIFLNDILEKDVDKSLYINRDDIIFTSKGNIIIGDYIVIQRKGGNGSLSKTIPKDSIKHPGNNIQLKLKIKDFVDSMKNYELANYFVYTSNK